MSGCWAPTGGDRRLASRGRHLLGPDLQVIRGRSLGDDLIKRGGHVSTFLKPLLSLTACRGGPVGTSSLTRLYLISLGRGTLAGSQRAGLGMPRPDSPAIGPLTGGGRAAPVDCGFLADGIVQKRIDFWLLKFNNHHGDYAREAPGFSSAVLHTAPAPITPRLAWAQARWRGG